VVQAGAPDLVIDVRGLTKRFGEQIAVDGLDLRMGAGEVHALLGPNGSGKTTTVRMLATLLRPDSGQALVLGHDVVAAAPAVRRHIALVGQFHALDERLTPVQNLTMFGRLHGMTKRNARSRALELLDRFGLADVANQPVSTYSGGMRRRVDLLAGLIVRPAVLFLDEPTTGLDPRSRNQVHEQVRAFVAEGTSVVLTTQYLDEADRLADRVTILDRGSTIATGTPTEIKQLLGQGIDVVVADRACVDDVTAVLAGFAARRTSVNATGAGDSVRISFAADGAELALMDVMNALHAASISVEDIGRHLVTLDEAFLALTDPGARAAAPAVPQPAMAKEIVR
jgi:ABC-2 type transport system ATP-binding protein/oleandomycin transport system ATP-binding protein